MRGQLGTQGVGMLLQVALQSGQNRAAIAATAFGILEIMLLEAPEIIQRAVQELQYVVVDVLHAEKMRDWYDGHSIAHHIAKAGS